MRPPRILLSIVLALLLAGVAACGGSTAPVTPAPSTTGPPTTDSPAATTVSPTTTTTTTVAPSTTSGPTVTTNGSLDIDWDYSDPADRPVVTLIDAGSEPRAVRVWSPQPGTTFAMSIKLTTSIEQTINGVTQAFEYTVELPATIEILEITDEGWISRATYRKPTVLIDDPDARAAIENEMASITGAVLYSLTAPDGSLIASAGLGGLPGAEFVPSNLGGAVSPLPAEAIGPGAVWESRGTLESAGLIFEQTTTMTVVDITGDRLTLEITADQTLDPDSPALFGITSFTFDAETSGVGIWDLALGTPVSATSEGTQTLDLSITLGDTTETLEQATAVSLEMTAEPID